MTIVNSLNPEIIGNDVGAPSVKTAVLDQAHLGDIHGALGTIAKDDFGPRSTFSARLKTLIAIVSPGFNDADAFGLYTQAGQNYGTKLQWTLLLIPVLSTRRRSCGSALSPASGRGSVEMTSYVTPLSPALLYISIRKSIARAKTYAERTFRCVCASERKLQRTSHVP